MKLMVVEILLEVSLVVCSFYLFQSVSYRHTFFSYSNRPKAQRSNDFGYQCFIRDFTSVCYSADGSCILAGGNSKYSMFASTKFRSKCFSKSFK